MTLKIVFSLCAATTLIACDATPPTITTTDIRQFNTDQAEADSLISTLPVAGTASYAGQLGGNVTFDGQPNYAILGDLALQANFSSTTGAVSGSVQNINLIKNGIPDQALEGNLNVVGGPTGPDTFNANASGLLEGQGIGDGFIGAADISLIMTGDVRSGPIGGPNQVLVGDWTGGNVGNPDEQDWTLTSRGTGGFYAYQQ